jgi:hypothetical protein
METGNPKLENRNSKFLRGLCAPVSVPSARNALPPRGLKSVSHRVPGVLTEVAEKIGELGTEFRLSALAGGSPVQKKRQSFIG